MREGQPNDPLPRVGDADLDAPERVQWFRDHFEQSPDEIIAFLGGDGISLEGRAVADIGCGEGIMDLALAIKGSPKRLTGFDINLTDSEDLLRRARHYGAADALPDNLEFKASEATRLPVPDGSYDIVVSWSAFEHVAEPERLLMEIRRVLRPHGVLMIQLWPFYFSEHGSHLWHWFPDGFVNLTHNPEEVEAQLRADTETDPEWIEAKLRDYRELNRLTVDGLQRAILASGMYVTKLELLSHPIHLSRALNVWPLTDLGIAGVKLLANPHPV